jgi:hypothetical protein
MKPFGKLRNYFDIVSDALELLKCDRDL